MANRPPTLPEKPDAATPAVATIPVFAQVIPHADGTATITRAKPAPGEITTPQAAALMNVSEDTMLLLRHDRLVGTILKWRPLSARPRSKIMWDSASVLAAKAKQYEMAGA